VVLGVVTPLYLPLIAPPSTFSFPHPSFNIISSISSIPLPFQVCLNQPLSTFLPKKTPLHFSTVIMVFGWGDSADAYQQVNNDQNSYDPNADPNTGSFGHEAVAGAAAFGAFKYYEDQQRKEGKPVEHAFAKEALAGLAAGEVDKLAETKGMDFVDREKAKRAAKENVNNMYDQQYGGQDNYDPNQPQHDSLNQYSDQDWSQGNNNNNY
jgi:hypothetical protein